MREKLLVRSKPLNNSCFELNVGKKSNLTNVRQSFSTLFQNQFQMKCTQVIRLCSVLLLINRYCTKNRKIVHHWAYVGYGKISELTKP